jgi:hypothetical protein
MDAQVLWFEWTRETPIDAHEVYTAVIDGGMGLSALRLLGEFEFGTGYAQLKGAMGAKLEYGGKNPAGGKWDIEIIGYEEQGPLTVYKISEFKQPEAYQQ